jgi:hypothetical protein
VRENEIATTWQPDRTEQDAAKVTESERELVLGMNVSARLAETLRAEARRLALAAKIEWVKVARETIAGKRGSDRT